MPLVAGKDGLRARVTIPQDIGPVQGLWELQAFVSANGVQRDGKVAFAVAQPTARFTGQAEVDRRPPRGDVAAADWCARSLRGARHAVCHRPGRPAAAGGAGAQRGVVRPRRRGCTCALPFASVALPRGYAAPFELRDLQLQDQGRMAPIESRAVALKF